MRRDATQPRAARGVDAALIAFAVGYFLLEWIPGIAGSYRYFIDEFYYLACANHPALGYVDHPPLSILLLWGIRGVFGDSLLAIRILPAVAGGATILLTGLLARRLGAGAFGQLIAAGAAMVGSIYHVTFGYYSMNALSVLLWVVGFRVLVEIELRDEPRLWLLFGLVAGIGLENKHTFILFPAALVIGMALTPARRHLARRWFWAGAGVCLLLFLPNLFWQAVTGWPSIEFYRNADFYKNVPTPPAAVLAQQILTMNPGAMPVWGAGLLFFLVTKGGRPFRHLGVVYAVLLLLMLIGQKSRPDRIADAYTVLFAGGGAWLGGAGARGGLRRLRWVLPPVLILSGLALTPLGIPVLPPPTAAAYCARLGVVPQIEKGEGKTTALPQWFADRLGWEEYVDAVATAARRIPPAERSRAIIFVPSYGQAGAIELLGRGRGLPPVYATQNNYFLWGPPGDSVEVALITGPFSEETLRAACAEVERVGVYDSDWCMPWRNHAPIWIVRGWKAPLSESWPRWGHYE